MSSAVVVAHPDDECLWLSSVLATVDRIVLCFGDQYQRPKSSAARRNAVAALELPGLIDLKLAESGAGFSIDWTAPQLTPTGIAIAEPAARARYDANYETLVAALRPVLAGCRDVYTHNPWGEYGHAEHIQVHRAVVALQAELGFTIWFSNYVSSVSWPLAQKLSAEPCWTERRTQATDRVLARRLMRVYVRYHAWTWTRFHRWPTEETVYAQPPTNAPDARFPLVGEQLTDVAALRPWPMPWRAATRRLG